MIKPLEQMRVVATTTTGKRINGKITTWVLIISNPKEIRRQLNCGKN